MKKELRRNKLYGAILISLGIISERVSGDATALLFLFVIGVILFVSKENYID